MGLLEKQGFTLLHGPDIAPDSENPARTSFDEVLLLQVLKNAVSRINPKVPSDCCEDAIRQIQRIASPELLANNETFHRLLTESIKVTFQDGGHSRGDQVWLIDWENPENNDFAVISQFTIVENQVNKRPDIILFVNGLPLVVLELKNATDENATLHSAFKQLETYQQAIPSLFTFNAIL